MKLEDKQLLKDVIESARENLDDILCEIGRSIESDCDLKAKLKYHPLDSTILQELGSLRTALGHNPDIYFHIETIKSIWFLLLERSVKCLRFFDTREPYITKTKDPMAYGMDELNKYFEKYSDFEGLLYGTQKSYRDHVVHIFRTWLLGAYILVRKDGDGYFADVIVVEGSTRDGVQLNFLEIVSMWTIVALCHDLGYPLEKSQKILNKTKEMMQYFVSNPQLNADMSFSGIQDYINNYIVKLMSSKMIKKEGDGDFYSGRIQPKYFIKLSKSLERSSHGVLSAIILYKTLVYFLESDFNINEDYFFNKDDVRQFYLRREILRAISAHTCRDIYHLNTNTLSFLLILCDELQEWDRRKFSDFYLGTGYVKREVDLKEFSLSNVLIEEAVTGIEARGLVEFFKSVYWQYENFKMILRDGQDTDRRSFGFQKLFRVTCDGVTVELGFAISQDQLSTLSIKSAEKKKSVDSAIKDFLKNCDYSESESGRFIVKSLNKNG